MRYPTNLFTYLKWRGDLPFLAVPPTTLDAMILAQLVYVDFSGIVPAPGVTGGITVREAARRYEMRYLKGKAPADYEQDETLLLTLAQGERFGGLLLNNYLEDTNYVEEKQFAAMQVHLSSADSFVVYRGTDGTLIGWKENFNMSYQLPGPGQKAAVKYMNSTAQDASRRYWVCGHSKGGNLAVYASTYCKEEIQKQIQRVSMFDAPGFYRSIWEDSEFLRMRGKLESFVPESSVVGMLMEYYPDYRVVYSSETGVSQHVLYSWLVDGPDFSYASQRDNPSYFMEGNLHEWIGRIPMNERKPFVDAFFAVLESTGIRRFSELKDMNFARFGNIVRAMTSIPQENRDTILRIVRMIRGESTLRIEE